MIQFYNCICLLSVLVSRHCWDQTETSISDWYFWLFLNESCSLTLSGPNRDEDFAPFGKFVILAAESPNFGFISKSRLIAGEKHQMSSKKLILFCYLDKYICAFSILLKNTFCKLVLSDRWWKALYEAQKLALPLEKDCSQMSRKCHSKILYTYKTTFYRHSLFFF